jgi:hypothetical protein
MFCVGDQILGQMSGHIPILERDGNMDKVRLVYIVHKNFLAFLFRLPRFCGSYSPPPSRIGSSPCSSILRRIFCFYY